MKATKRGIVVVVFALCAAVCGAGNRNQLSPTKKALNPQAVPQFGNFYSLQAELSDHGWPPLPFNPFANSDVPVPVYSLGRGYYVYDDSLIDYGCQLSFKRAETDVSGVIGESAVLTSLTMNVPFPGDEGGGGAQTNPLPDPRRNFEKFMGQAFSLVDTNDAAINNTNLYYACLSFPDDTNTAPTLQIARYGTNAVLIKANHFDYSQETTHDFALLVCDTVDKPVWKSVDLTGASDSQDGWLIQGLVARRKVVDPMYLLVENLPTTNNAFFQMQGDVYLNFRLAKKVNIYLDKGIYSAFEIFGLLNILPGNGYIKIGKFLPNYGTRLDDHRTFIRDRAGFNPESGRAELTGAEIGRASCRERV